VGGARIVRYFTDVEKARAKAMWLEGKNWKDITAAIGCSRDTLRCRWIPKWKAEQGEAAEKVKKKVEKKCERQLLELEETKIAIEKMELDHLLAMRGQYLALRSIIVNTDPEKMKLPDLIALFREMRETLMASAKLEGVEPPQKVLNVNVNTDAASLKARLRQYEELFSHE